MQSKTIFAVLVAAAFVAGSLMTGTSAFASGDKKGKPFEEIWAAIHALEGDMDDLEDDLEDVVNDDSDEESDLSKTYVRTAGAFQKVFCDFGDYATSGGAIGQGFGLPLNAQGDVVKDGDAITGWHNFGSGTSFVICVDVT
ncbi:MAG: hypothetical protein ACE5RJ_02245 [Nitrosopumilaceae archaeon]